MGNLTLVCNDRRIGRPDEREKKEDRRSRSFMLKDDLLKCFDHQKWKHEKLLQLVDSKENKILTLVKTSFGVFAIIAGMIAAVATLLSKYSDNDILATTLTISLCLIVIGVNFINITSIRYIASLKSDMLLALRQLNCVRQSIHSLIYILIHGKEPPQGFDKRKGSSNLAMDNIYYRLIGQHVKYPLNNENLRARYLCKHKNNASYGFDIRALYRCSDLFAICAVIAFNICVTAVPLIILLHYYTFQDSFWYGAIFVLGAFALLFGFGYSVYRIIKTFFGIITSPLCPEAPMVEYENDTF